MNSNQVTLVEQQNRFFQLLSERQFFLPDSRLFIAGGVVRDLFLGLQGPLKDIDIVVEGDAIEFAEALRNQIGGDLKVFSKFRTAKLIEPESYPALKEIDFASARKEVYRKPGALPEVTLSVIEEDLKRRDFTVNAMAVSVSDYYEIITGKEDSGLLESCVLDFFEGKKDISDRLIRVLHEESFLDDPTRIFRACRYAVRIDGGLEVETEVFLRRALKHQALESISVFRVFTELRKIINEQKAADSLRLLSALGVFEYFELISPDKEGRFFSEIEKLRAGTEDPERLFQEFLSLLFYVNPLAENWLPALNLSRKFKGRIRKGVESLKDFSSEAD